MRKGIVVSYLIFFLCLVLGGTAYGGDAHKKSVLTIGRFSDKALKEQRQLGPIITYLASRLKDVGIEKGEVIYIRDNESVIKYLKDGSLDIVLETPFSAYLYKIEADATPILLVCRKGVAEYNSVIFVRKDSEISRLEDLKGKLIAFEDPGSTSAYFLPKVSMEAKSLDLVQVDHVVTAVPGDKVGYIFAGSELNISTWVFFGRVNAGALSNTEWLDQSDNPEAYRKHFKIIYETQKIPRMFVIIRKGLDKKLVGRVKEELLNMAGNEEGRKALKPFKLQEFLELPGGVEAALKPIENLLAKQ